MQVEDLLEQSSRLDPAKVALIVGGERYTYDDLRRRSHQLAHALRGAGVRRGDRVAVFMENSAEAVISIFAILKAGAAFVVLHPTTKTEKLAQILNNCRTAAILSQAKLRSVVEPAVREIPSVRLTVLAGPDPESPPESGARWLRWEDALGRHAKDGEAAPPSEGIDVDLATIIYTSGSSGTPKGVMMTHLNVLTAAHSISQYLEMSREDVILSVLPLSFDYGLYQVFLTFLTGGTLVLEKSFAYPAYMLDRLGSERVTGFPIIPTIAAILLQLKDLSPGRFPHLRFISSTAAALQPAHIRRLRELFPATRLYSMYGLTECKRVSYLPPEQLDHRPESVGKAIPNTEVYVVDGEGNRVRPGEVGELVVRGAHVMRGYWENPEETDRMLKPGPLPGEKVL